jgi:3-oxoacyl-[acyl-carrier protein] reductase
MSLAAATLAGRTAVVTGGSRGIGRGIVGSLARAGATVIFCGRDEEAGARTRNDMLAEGHSVRFIAADLESEAGTEAFVLEAQKTASVDILINNVGGAHDADAGMRDFDAIPVGDWSKTFMKCVFNAVGLIDGFLPGMRARGWGRIINISSVAGIEPGHSPADYSSAKAALNTLTLALSTSLARSGITANVVAPGPILTDSLQNFIDSIAESRGWTERGDALEQRFLAEVMPLKVKRIGRPDDIGAAVAFLASPSADYITGANLRVDGGLSAAAI